LILNPLFKTAPKANASDLILLHNHPSGNLNHSETGRNITDKSKSAGKVLDIYFSDHLILTSESYFFMADEGMLGINMAPL